MLLSQESKRPKGGWGVWFSGKPVYARCGLYLVGADKPPS